MDISNRPGLMFIKQALVLEMLLSNEALEGVHLVCDFKIHELDSEMLNKLEVSNLESISFCDDKVIYPTASQSRGD